MSATAATLQTTCAGRRRALFGLAFATGVLTILTLGIYRFWMKTRLRRYYWSSIRPGNVPLEYVGRPTEKLVGFLIAVCFLAFYIGIVNLALMFLSLSYLHSAGWAYAVTLVGLLPVYFYARYRARRYILGRTRWRGIRFGVEPGAWGYVWRALVHWAVTILSLGLLWPRMTFALEKYRTERSSFGNAAMTQGGRWTMLYRPFLLILVAVLLVLVGLMLVANQPLAGYALLVFAVPFGLYATVHYRVHSFRLLTNAKTVGPLGFRARPRPLRVLRTYVFGYALTGLAMLALVSVLAGAFLVLSTAVGTDLSRASVAAVGRDLPLWLGAAFGVTGYFLTFLMWSVMRQVMVTLPLLRHYAETTEILHPETLAEVRQSPRDELVQAEGFADALDIGAAI